MMCAVCMHPRCTIKLLCRQTYKVQCHRISFPQPAWLCSSPSTVNLKNNVKYNVFEVMQVMAKAIHVHVFQIQGTYGYNSVSLNLKLMIKMPCYKHKRLRHDLNPLCRLQGTHIYMNTYIMLLVKVNQIHPHIHVCMPYIIMPCTSTSEYMYMYD